MKIAHICLSNWYVDGWSYQENELIRQHVIDGHNVLVLASTEVQNVDGINTYLEPHEYVGSEGAKIKRLPYRFGPHSLMKKIRAHPRVNFELQIFQPDAILFHGTCGWEVITVANYARAHPDVQFYIDSHEDANNSARSFISREILHKLFYKYCLSRAWPIAKKVLCISTETIDFVNKMYGVPMEKIEFFPLGGKIPSDDQYNLLRDEGRKKLGILPEEILFLQAGKQTTAKKLIESMKAFNATPSHAKMVIAGSLDSAIETEAVSLISQNPRITYLGWQSVDEMALLLCAADVYLQPGTQSVTMQNSLCCRCVPILANAPSHKIFMDNNGWLVDNQHDLQAAILKACEVQLGPMSLKSLGVAKRLLDYEIMSKRILR